MRQIAKISPLHRLIALIALALLLVFSSRSWAAGEEVALQSYITVGVTEDTSDDDNVSNTFTVTWSDTQECTEAYNAYLEYWTSFLWGEAWMHLGSARAGASQITKTATGLRATGLGYKVHLYCGIRHGVDRLVSTVWIAQNLKNYGNNLRPAPGTYSSEPPLTALTVSPGTLTPSFHSHTIFYRVPGCHPCQQPDHDHYHCAVRLPGRVPNLTGWPPLNNVPGYRFRCALH